MKINLLSYKKAARSKNVFLALFKNQSLKNEEFFSYLPSSAQKVLLQFAKREFRGDEDETKSLWLPKGRPEHIVLFGLDEKAKWNEHKIPLLARRLTQYAKAEKLKEFTTPLFQVERATEIFVINALMAQFEFNVYKERPQGGWPEVKTIYLAVAKPQRGNEASTLIKKTIQEGIFTGEEVNRCRELVNTPGGDMTPEKLAEAAQRVGKRVGITVTILNEKDLKKLGMGGVLGVAQGSVQQPKFIILEYKGSSEKSAARGDRRPLVLVGKGVTFDTGGLNLKPEQAIYEMHMDMSGGAAVIHGIAAIARLKLPINVVGLIPAVENMPSGSSYRPGDLLKTMSGKTIEVLNTDAEGRVILSDALTYGSRLKPGLMVDFATLTGAAHVALGNYCSALFTQNEDLQRKLVEVGQRSGDYVWPLPLWDEYLAEIKGTFGDVANIGNTPMGGRVGGAIHGAKFLEQFVENTPWAHIDIAPRMTAAETEFLAKGATGVGVRFIVELAKEYPHL